MRSSTAACAAVLIVVGVAGCSSSSPASRAESGIPSGTPSGAPSAASSGPSVASPTGGTAPATGAPVGVAAPFPPISTAMTSAHVAVTVTESGQSVRATVDERLTHGAITAARLSLVLSGRTYEIVRIGGQVYADVPNPERPGRPWVRLGTDAASVSLLRVVGLVLAYSTPTYFAQLRAAAADVRRQPVRTIAGVRVTPYVVTVAVASLPATSRVRESLAGVTTFPAAFSLDARGRVVAYEHRYASPTASQVYAAFTRFDAAVRVVAPPAGQISAP